MLKRVRPLWIVVLALSLACASANLTAYKTVGALVDAVDLAMKGWGAYVVQQRATPGADLAALAAKEDQVKKVYAGYQAAMVAVQAVQPGFSSGAPVPDQIGTAATALFNLLKTLEGK